MTPLIELYINLDDGLPVIEWLSATTSVHQLRHQEKEIAEYRRNVPENQSYVAIYDMRALVRIEAILSLTATVGVIFALGLATMVFSSMRTELLIVPLEAMVEKI